MEVHRRVWSSWVAKPNTPESDLMPEVMHKVTCDSVTGAKETVLVMAAEPGHALDKVASMPPDEYARLQRTEE